MPDEGVDRLGRRRPRPDRGPEREARGPRASSASRRPADLQLRHPGRGHARRDHARDPRRRTTSRTRRSRSRSCARSAPSRRSTPTSRTCSATDGKKLSKRHGAHVGRGVPRARATSPRRSSTSSRCSAGPTTTRRRSSRATSWSSSSRSSASAPSPAVFDYQKLDWLNGVYLRELSPEEYADRVVTYLREQGIDWDEELVRRAAPLVQEKIETLGEFPDFAGFLFEEVEPDAALLDGAGPVLEQAEQTARRRRAVRRPSRSSRRCARSPSGSELKPREAFQPIRVAVTGSKVSPGLFESIELLGRDETLERLRRCPRRSGLGGASGSSARWNSSQARRRKLAVGRGQLVCRAAAARASYGSERVRLSHFKSGKRPNARSREIRQDVRPIDSSARWRGGDRRRCSSSTTIPRSGSSAASTWSSRATRVVEAETRRRAHERRSTRRAVDVVLLDVHLGDERRARRSCRRSARSAACGRRLLTGSPGDRSARRARRVIRKPFAIDELTGHRPPPGRSRAAATLG